MREVGIFLLREENLDLEKAEELVRLQETSHKMLQGRLSTRNISTVNFGVICQFCGEIDHSAKECRSTRANWRNVQRNVEKGCYSCGKPGHFARECRTFGRSEQINQVVCISCKRTGHWSRECPTKNWRETQYHNNHHCQVSKELKIGNIRRVYLDQNKSEEIPKNEITEIQKSESRIEKRSAQAAEKINDDILTKANEESLP
ncbi:uncharacterized protein LOC123683048 [Harmonia axyridis]|uniref:uncharacterized protein LOC123683048 n=1 Tax=Harmonia axyridis TaxID=115357 RepID=UPI001E2767C3|nr:uncharacterized protein LOC123683048 [Harmonia axyridis]